MKTTSTRIPRILAIRILLILSAVLIGISGHTQAPQSFPYQAVARNTSGNLIANQTISLRVSIHDLTASGAVIYRETHSATTNSLGLFMVNIGQGIPAVGTFSSVTWNSGSKFLQIELDPLGGIVYADMGTTQLLSVPYALYAEKSGSATLNGTTNQLVKFTGTNTGENSILYDNGTNIGIGTQNPQAKLHIYGGDLFIQSSSGAFVLGYQSSNQWRFATTGGGADMMWQTTTDGTFFTPTHYFKQNGDVGFGVGIGVPTARLDLMGSGSTSATVNCNFRNAASLSLFKMRDDGNIGINTGPSTVYKVNISNVELLANGDGQSGLFTTRSRDSRNDGFSYGLSGTNKATCGYNIWGDNYTFGDASFNYNDFNRCGGSLGADVNGFYWGSLGYRSSANVNYGVYGSAAYTSGGGQLPTTSLNGIGGGFFGTIGSVSKGSVIGQLNEGELFAAYNQGDVYTSGKQIDLVNNGDQLTPSYGATSPELTVYTKGTIHLVKGEAKITFDEAYRRLLGEEPVVTVSAMGKCNGVYLDEVTKDGFMVKEQNDGHSDILVSWIAVGNRCDAKNKAIPEMFKQKGFTRSFSQALFNDGNRKQSGLGMWWNGRSLEFGNISTSVDLTRAEKTRLLEQEKSATTSNE